MSPLRASEVFDTENGGRPAVSRGLRASTAEGVAWTLIGNLGSRIVSTAVMVLLTRLLLPGAFGVVAVATVLMMVLTVIVDGGFAAALVQVDSMTRRHYDTAFWTSAASGVIATGIALIASAPFASAFNEPLLAPVLRWSSLVLLIAGFSSIPQAVLQRRMQFQSLAMRLLFANVIGGAVGVGLALSGAGVWAIVAQTVVKQAVQAAVVWWACPIVPGFSVSRPIFRSMFKFGLGTTGLQALNTLNKRSDDLLIGKFLGTVALGYYSVAYSLLLLLNQLMMQTISQVAFPLFARLQGDQERMRQAMFEVVRLASLVTLPVYAGVVVLAPDIVSVAFGARWARSVPVMQILATVGLPQTLWVFLGTMLIGAGRSAWSLRINAIYTIMLVVGFAIAVHWGIVAVATSFAASTLIFTPIQLKLVQRVIPFSIPRYLAQMRGPFIGVSAMALVLYPLRSAMDPVVPEILRLVGCALLGIVVYVGTLRLVARPLLVEAGVVGAAFLPGSLRVRFGLGASDSS